jgi:diguanylate cyclase (GGDEF)-like protein
MTPLMQMLKPAPFFVLPGLASEQGQAFVRFCWALAFATYLYLNDRFTGTPQYTTAWILAAGHFIFASAVWRLVRTSSTGIQVRRACVAILDQALFAATLYLTGEIAAPFVLMPVLLTFGSGLRYGRTHAVLSSTISSVLTCAALMYSPYWEQYPAIQLGLAVATIVLPLYIFRLTDALALDMRTDSMTQLRNRIGFDELLNEVCELCTSAKHERAVVLIDLDGFKKINDVQGHDGGDLVLKHVAHWLRLELGVLGVPARFGGDEFAVIVRTRFVHEELETALAQFLKRAEAVGQLFGSPLGASVGVYYLQPASAITPRFAFKAADQLMYKAKKLGKNQFVTSTNQNFSADGDLVELPIRSLTAEQISPTAAASTLQTTGLIT